MSENMRLAKALIRVCQAQGDDDKYFETKEYKDLEEKAKAQYDKLLSIHKSVKDLEKEVKEYDKWLAKNEIQELLSDQANKPNEAIIETLKSLLDVF
jgi:uncharacterized protein YlxW (UPF0749 family)